MRSLAQNVLELAKALKSMGEVMDTNAKTFKEAIANLDARVAALEEEDLV